MKMRVNSVWVWTAAAACALGICVWLKNSSSVDPSAGTTAAATDIGSDSIAARRQATASGASTGAQPQLAPPQSTDEKQPPPWRKRLADAMHERDPESRFVAERFSLMCISLHNSNQPSLDDARVSSPSNPTSLLAEQLSARQHLEALCSSVPNSLTLIDDLHRAGIGSGPLEKALVRGSRNGHDQEFDQAITVVLSNPSGYSAAFDTWLEHSLSANLQSRYGLSEVQSLAVQDMLYSELTGAPGEEFGEIRQQERCALWGTCTTNTALSDDERVTARRAASQVQKQIQQQQWASLIPGS